VSLLHAEYLKLSRRKLYPTMVLVLVILALVTAFFTLLFDQLFPDFSEGLPTVQKPQAYDFGVQQMAAQTWFPMLLAAVVMGGELTGTVWATALTRESSVVRHVLARLRVYVVASWIAYMVAIAVWAGFTALFAEGSGGLSATEWLDHVWKLGLVAATWAALGLGAVSMLRSVGPAIGAVLAFYFLESLISLWDPYENVSAAAASNAIFGVDVPAGFSQFIPGADMTMVHAVLVLAGWTTVGFLLTWWGLRRRDA
jgi:hypothetical protein